MASPDDPTPAPRRKRSTSSKRSTNSTSSKRSERPTPTPPPASPAAPAPATDPDENLLAMIGRGVVPPVLQDSRRRVELGLPEDATKPGRYMIELNIQYRGGLREAGLAFHALWTEVLGSDASAVAPPIEISKSYFQCWLSVDQWRRLLRVDEERARENPGLRVIYKLWPDFKVKSLIDRSVATVKADAAIKSYGASGAGIVWAVVDSGIDGWHPHFGSQSDALNSSIYHPSVVELHRDFTVPAVDDSWKSALADELGHGTHVAGIIAGRLPEGSRQFGTSDPHAPPMLQGAAEYAVYEQVFEADPEGNQQFNGKVPVQRNVRRADALHGVAPECLLVSLKVIDANDEGHVSDVMRALVYVREHLNDDPKMLRVHGVNLSIGYDFDAQMFACGQSPLCVEVDRLVRSGVVVVTAAGNTGYGKLSASQRTTKAGLSSTINDPGNSALAITVGATHRDSPHTYGVSYFSSKGPTGDGRLKPDLVAPGERITSCASTSKCASFGLHHEAGVAAYIDDSGTSMAAPHVSGAIAAFLSIRREFIQRPEDVKRIFLDSATSLGRERYFEGHGLVDLMRAIQSI